MTLRQKLIAEQEKISQYFSRSLKDREIPYEQLVIILQRLDKIRALLSDQSEKKLSDAEVMLRYLDL